MMLIIFLVINEMRLSEPADFKYLPLMFSFICGILTLVITFCINYALFFSSVDLFGLGLAWQFGPRELVHLTGSLGAVLVSWPILQVVSQSRPDKLFYFCAFFYFVIAMFVHRFLVYEESEFRFLLWGGAYIVFSCILLTSSFLNNKNSRASWLLIFSACLIEIFNLWWELVQQPLLGSRGDAPRGYCQLAQVLCDFLGVVAGFYLSRFILKVFNVLRLRATKDTASLG